MAHMAGVRTCSIFNQHRMPSMGMCCRAAFIIVLLQHSFQIQTPASDIVLTNAVYSQSASSPWRFTSGLESAERETRQKRGRKPSDSTEQRQAFRKSLRSSAPSRLDGAQKRNSSTPKRNSSSSSTSGRRLSFPEKETLYSESQHLPPGAGHRRAKRQRARRYCDESDSPLPETRIRRSLRFSVSPFNEATGSPVTPEDEMEAQVFMEKRSAKKESGIASDTSTEEECALDTQWLMQGEGDIEMMSDQKREGEMMSESWWRKQRFVDFQTGKARKALGASQLREGGWRPFIIGRSDNRTRHVYGDEGHDLFTVIDDGWHPTSYILRVSNCRTQEEVHQHAAETAMNYVLAGSRHVLFCCRMWRRGGRSFAMSTPCASTLSHHFQTIFGAYNPRQAMEIVRQILVGLAEIHREGYVHADLNPSTILIMPDGGVQIGALHKIVASKHGAGALRQSNKAYLAPELLYLAALNATATRAKPSQELDDSRKSNVYAAGLILFQLLTEQASLSSRLGGQQLSAMRQAGVSTLASSPLLWGRVFAAPFAPYPEWHLLDRMLDSNPRTRPSASELLASLTYFREPRP